MWLYYFIFYYKIINCLGGSLSVYGHFFRNCHKIKIIQTVLPLLFGTSKLRPQASWPREKRNNCCHQCRRPDGACYVGACVTDRQDKHTNKPTTPVALLRQMHTLLFKRKPEFKFII